MFDKTGTVTHGSDPEITFTGDISEIELSHVKKADWILHASLSSLSLSMSKPMALLWSLISKNFREKGIQGRIDRRDYKIGSAIFAGFHQKLNTTASHVFVSIDGECRGYFTIRTSVRLNFGEMIQRLGDKCHAVLSGDHHADREEMRALFGEHVDLRFEQTPQDKLDYIRDLQRQGKNVLMIGDGLNDAGALKQSDVGLAVTDDTGIFTPACDGILLGEKITSLDKILRFAKTSSTILKTGFAISFFYNAITLTIAVTGHLTPLVAAIIMPISSISVVGFSTLAVKLTASRFKML